MVTAAILKFFLKILLETLDCRAEDQSPKEDTRREANKMQELELSFMLNFWNEILQTFHKVILQNDDVNLKHV